MSSGGLCTSVVKERESRCANCTIDNEKGRKRGCKKYVNSRLGGNSCFRTERLRMMFSCHDRRPIGGGPSVEIVPPERETLHVIDGGGFFGLDIGTLALYRLLQLKWPASLGYAIFPHSPGAKKEDFLSPSENAFSVD